MRKPEVYTKATNSFRLSCLNLQRWKSVPTAMAGRAFWPSNQAHKWTRSSLWCAVLWCRIQSDTHNPPRPSFRCQDWCKTSSALSMSSLFSLPLIFPCHPLSLYPSSPHFNSSSSLLQLMSPHVMKRTQVPQRFFTLAISPSIVWEPMQYNWLTLNWHLAHPGRLW